MKLKAISELEQQVMEVVWQHPQSSVRDIMNRLTDHKPLAYTTVMTLVQRLYDKGLLIRYEQGKAFVYSAKMSKSTYCKSLAGNFLKNLIGHFGDVGIASFASSIDTLSDTKRDQLLHLLEKHEPPAKHKKNK